MMDGREEALCQYVEYDDIDNVKRLLDEGELKLRINN